VRDGTRTLGSALGDARFVRGMMERPLLPIVYSDEVWTEIEYHHLRRVSIR